MLEIKKRAKIKCVCLREEKYKAWRKKCKQGTIGLLNFLHLFYYLFFPYRLNNRSENPLLLILSRFNEI